MANILDSHTHLNKFKTYTGITPTEGSNVLSAYIIERTILRKLKEAFSQEPKDKMFLLGKRMMPKDDCFIFIEEKVQKTKKASALKSMFDYLVKEGAEEFLKNITKLKKITKGE